MVLVPFLRRLLPVPRAASEALSPFARAMVVPPSSAADARDAGLLGRALPVVAGWRYIRPTVEQPFHRRGRAHSGRPSCYLFDVQRSHTGIYDRIGHGYVGRRLPDARIATQIEAALGDVRRICNVGAGTGSYEPAGREIVAVEPSWTMIWQRRGGTVVRARGEELPFAERSFDAALAVLTIHHWQDYRTGLGELRRIAPRRVVLTFDPTRTSDFWLVRDYLPAIRDLDAGRCPAIDAVAAALGGARVEVVPIAWDCSDGFQAAYWRRPERYLDPAVRASISTMAMLPDEMVEHAIERLRADLDSGAFWERHADLRQRTAMDYGYRLLVSDDGSGGGA